MVQLKNAVQIIPFSMSSDFPDSSSSSSVSVDGTIKMKLMKRERECNDYVVKWFA